MNKIYINQEIIQTLQELNELADEELKNIPDLAILEFKKFYNDLLINGEAIHIEKPQSEEDKCLHLI